MKEKDIKQIVKEKYSLIAEQSETQGKSSCCGTSSCCSDIDYTVFSESYEKLNGYNENADLGLGCGIPTEFAGIKPGDFVLDLGSGAGNDCFVARSEVGESGKVVGLDFSEEMIDKARKNLEKLGFANIEFVLGDIENMPLENNFFDVVISNCVLNLAPDKKKVFSEIMRVLKNGGRFCVSDVVHVGDFPEKLKEDAEMYAGCVAGAIKLEDYLGLIEKAGFKNIKIHKKRNLSIPEIILNQYFNESELEKFKSEENGIYSITVSGEKF
jgi:arsenite methyltransferase